MKLKGKLFIIGLAILGVMYPSTVHADQGVWLRGYEVKDEAGNVVHSYKKGDRIQFEERSEETYQIVINKSKYVIDNKDILKTEKEEEISLNVVSEKADIRLTPSIFGLPIQTLSKGEVVYRTDKPSINEYWVEIETNKGIIGSVYSDHLIPTYKKTPHGTTAYVVKEGEVNNRYFDYGEEVLLTDFKDNHFVVKRETEEYPLLEERISFEKPKAPLIITPTDKHPDQLKIYGKPTYIPPIHMKNPPVTSKYGIRWGKLHAGTDIGIPTGTPLYAVADGVVSKTVTNQSHSKKSWGNYVKINHGTEDTLYGHMSTVTVKQGENIKQGQLIGYSGNTGISTGPHLHFELYRDGIRVDSHFIVYQPELYR